MIDIYKKIAVPHKPVKGIQYGLCRPEDIRALSWGEINLKGGSEFDTGTPGTPYYIGLGTTSYSYKCGTCGLKRAEDPGHFGHIEFAFPVINPLFISKVFSIVSSMCLTCGKLLVTSDKRAKIMRISRERRISAVSYEAKKYRTAGKCPFCPGKIAPLITDRLMKISIVGKDGERELLLPIHIADLFRKLPNNDIELLGLSPIYSRPEWMIMENVLIIPPTMRPMVVNVDGNKSEDNMTKHLPGILDNNNKLRDYIAKERAKDKTLSIADIFRSSKKIMNTYEGLALTVSLMIKSPTNKKAGLMYYSSNKKVQSLQEVFAGKTGVFRRNVLGKRIDFAARTVISPEVAGNVDQVVISLKMAMKLSYPEIVTKYNEKHMKKLVMAGGNEYPGAIEVRKAKTGSSYILKDVSRDICGKVADELQVGDIVERHLVNGDYVIFNRQPTLHKLSFMTMQVVVIPGNTTLRLNLASTSPYNADFDGDECTIHVLRTQPTRAEGHGITQVRNHVINPGNSGVIVSPIQDNILGTFLISRYAEMQIDAVNFIQIVSSAIHYRESAFVQGKTQYKYIEMLEAILPGDLSMTSGSIAIKNGKFLKIRRKIAGKTRKKWIPQVAEMRATAKMLYNDQRMRDETIEELLSGEPDDEPPVFVEEYPLITKRIVKNVLVKTIFNIYGPTRTNNFIVALQRLTNSFLMYHGFTCSINDMVVPDQLTQKMQQNIQELHDEVADILLDIDAGKIHAPLTKTPLENYEDLVRNAIGRRARANEELLEKYVKSQEIHNLGLMIAAGSKGSSINYRQIADNIGQTTVKGRRIPKKYGDGGRSLPHMPKFTEDLKMRGYVPNPFIKGMTAIGYFFHAYGGRAGIIDTALGVSDVGYLSRKFITFMERCIISYDNFVRYPDGTIISYTYAGSGFDMTHMNKRDVVLYKISIGDFVEIFV